ncbi:MAG: hypothetical protein RBS16_08580 [Candidatus Cloacimonadales bacterium]|jgi:hypothetical protein|nr:hypothetical protein [Candidatus Cloacimonadales bacterium]
MYKGKRVQKEYEKRIKLFDKTQKKAFSYLDKNDEQAAVFFQITCHLAHKNNFGLYYSHEIENALQEISLSHVTCRDLPPSDRIRNVLHIATEINTIGGHNRILQNWISYSNILKNDLVITNQNQNCTSKELIYFFNKLGAKLYFLKNDKKDILSRAKMLYNIATNYDAIVLHIHHYDVIPSIALSKFKRPIMLLNHADHSFWVGRNITNLILEIRETGKTLSKQKRNIPETNQYILPIPLQKKETIKKHEARQILKINQDDIIVFSVASTHKYIPIEGRGINELFLSLSNRYDNIKIIVVGPDKSTKFWQDLYINSNYKVNAIGGKNNICLYYIASDFYVDSYPISSLTSLLDAAKYRVPIFSINNNNDPYSIDDIALNNIKFKFSSFHELEERIAHLISNKKEYLAYSEQCYSSISKYHLEDGWIIFLNEAYRKAIKLPKIHSISTNKTQYFFDDYEVNSIRINQNDAFTDYYNIIKKHWLSLSVKNKTDFFITITLYVIVRPKFFLSSLLRLYFKRKVR